MITCPSCNHQNPEGSLQCENCYTPLTSTTSCPNCGASIQTDATFCGQCGFNLQAVSSPVSAPIEETEIGPMPDVSLEEMSLPNKTSLSDESPEILAETSMSSPMISPWDDYDEQDSEDFTTAQTKGFSDDFPEVPSTTDETSVMPETLKTEFPEIADNSAREVIMPWESEAPEPDLETEQTQSETMKPSVESKQPEVIVETNISAPEPIKPNSKGDAYKLVTDMIGATQLQTQTASLLHLQSNTTIEIASNLDVVHIGKPNGQIPPDIDVAGFPDSEVVSRVHADIRVEGDAYYIEDIGSSNGTYINHSPLLQGNRHRLRAGDRIALGKGDLVTFIFQLT